MASKIYRGFAIRWVLTHLVVMSLLFFPTYWATLFLDFFVLLLFGAITYLYPFLMLAIQEVLIRRLFGEAAPFWKWWWLTSSLLWMLGFFISTILFPEQWDEPMPIILANTFTWTIPVLLQTVRIHRQTKLGYWWFGAGFIAALLHGVYINLFFNTMGISLLDSLPLVTIILILMQSGVTTTALIFIHRRSLTDG